MIKGPNRSLIVVTVGKMGARMTQRTVKVEIILSGPMRRNFIVSSTAKMNCLLVKQRQLRGLVAVPPVRPVASTLMKNHIPPREEAPHETSNPDVPKCHPIDDHSSPRLRKQQPSKQRWIRWQICTGRKRWKRGHPRQRRRGR